MATAETEPQDKRRVCQACGSGHLVVLVHLKPSKARTPLAYLKCERCAHIVIGEG